MSKDTNNEFYNEATNEDSIDFLALFMKYFSYWKWFIASVAFCISIAFLYLRYTTPIYKVKTTVLIKDDKKGGGMDDMKALQSLGMFDMKNNVDNEIEVLKTGSLMEGVVRKMGNYVTYIKVGRIRDVELYGKECPVLFSLTEAQIETIPTGGFAFDLLVQPDGKLRFSGKFKQKKYELTANRYDSIVALPFGKLRQVPGIFQTQDAMEMKVVIHKPITMALDIINRLDVAITGKTTSVVYINLKTVHPKRGMDLLQSFIEVYNKDDMDDQNLVAQNTAIFIEDRLNTLTGELTGVEQRVEDYKQREQLTDLTSDAQLLLNRSQSIDAQRLEVETQYSIIQDLEQYVNRKENENQLLPAGTGIQSTTLNALIGEYNNFVLQRNRLSRTATASNQAMIDLTDQINSLSKTIKASVAQEKRSLSIQRSDINRQVELTSALIKSVPRKEREYMEIQRQQSVKSALYLFLLQKKEENFLSMTSVVPKAKIIDQPRLDGDGPITPKRNIILILALVFGLSIPIVVLYIKELLKFFVENKAELEKLTTIPILGEIPKSEEGGNIVLHQHSTNTMAEMFRLLRTNLLFVLGKDNRKVVLVTSSVGGEGKTFFAINLGLSLAFLNKRVLIIGLDLRKPKLSEYLGLENKTGISMFLSGHLDAVNLIRPSGVHVGLDILPAGPVPPNPNELLDSPELGLIIEGYKQQYDYIILDTAPVGAVSDTYMLTRYADVSIYLVRAEYTHKDNIIDANKLKLENKFTNMYMVLNSSDIHKASYRYGYGKKYGYGGRYGYGKKYGYGNYGEEQKV